MTTGLPPWKNKLYFGDNLDVLREYVSDVSVDLVYLDPPFNSNATYNVLFAEQGGDKSVAQITAFEDTWHWGRESEIAYQEVVKDGPKQLSDLLQALRSFLGQNDMMAYLTMMAPRIVELHRVLKPSGSIYLHCDPTSSHYLKLLMDAIFGLSNFRNEIVWKRGHTFKHSGNQFPRVHDVLLFYSKGSQVIFRKIFREYEQGTLRNYTYDDNDGRGVYRLQALRTYGEETIKKFEKDNRIYVTGSGKKWLKQYLNEKAGKSVDDFWDDIPSMEILRDEQLGFPTQKPESLLERILEASSKEGDTVLDPFCGCGTTITVAERLNRHWIGIDITHLAIALMRHRLQTTLGSELSPYEVVGDPKDLSSAEALAKHDRYKFEWWALGLAEARPAQDKKKGTDSGIDGYIKFFDDNSSIAKTIIVQVKSGHVGVKDIRDLKGVLEREHAPIGVFVTLQRPTRDMLKEATTTGFYMPEDFEKLRFPRLQILTIEQLLNGQQVEYPPFAPAATFKRSQQKGKETPEKQNHLF